MQTSSLFRTVAQFVQREQLFTTTDRLLLAISGGIDSVVLAHLLAEGGYSFGLAHCNFCLRGAESAGDTRFVRALAADLEVPFFYTHIDTPRLVAALPHQSVQMVARRERYHWLEQCRQREDYHYILTAHHLDDGIETFLLNFTRGAGLKGLRGIPTRNGRLRRPLLCTDRATLAAYAQTYDIAYREDSSNATEHYQRNRLRHRVLPVLRDLNPDLGTTAANNFAHLRHAWQLYHYAAQLHYQQCVTEIPTGLAIDLPTLRQWTYAPTLLYEWLQPYRFSAEQARQALHSRTGTLLYSPTHQLLVSYEQLQLADRSSDTAGAVLLWPYEQDTLLLPNGDRLVQHLQSGLPAQLVTEPHTALLDAQKITYPLQLRHWQPGDVFFPFGMGGRRKKLQDFFSDAKIDRLARHRCWLLVNGNDDILWVVGHRTDERYRVGPDTDKYIVVRYQPGA